jgi:hypothetical protein
MGGRHEQGGVMLVAGLTDDRMRALNVDLALDQLVLDLLRKVTLGPLGLGKLEVDGFGDARRTR